MEFFRTLKAFSAAGQFALLACALFSGTGPALAGNANVVMTLKSEPIDPVDGKARASVSRDPSTADPQGATFVAAYTVSIYNPTNSSKNFRFEGDVSVAASSDGATAPTQFVSSRSDCKLTQSTNPVHITCAKLEVAKGATIDFRFEFRTPTAGSSMALDASLYFPATSSGTITASGATSIELVKRLAIEYRLGFNTFVPTTGGTFFSGDGGNLPGSPGGVATTDDPFTTTVVIPPIGFTTSALVQELQKGELMGCANRAYLPGGCFESSVKIPSDPGALKGMKIYLRIDRTKTYSDADINSAVIRYFDKNDVEYSPVPNCSATVVASSGKPCIRNRKQYGIAGVPDEWKLDWEFLIEAVDNGRYLN